jgi:hypothetical protein
MDPSSRAPSSPRREVLREVGAVLRMSEAEAAKLGDCPSTPTRIRR